MKEFISQNVVYLHGLIFLVQTFFFYRQYKDYIWKKNREEWLETCRKAIELTEIAEKKCEIAILTQKHYFDLQVELMEKLNEKIILDKKSNI